MNMLLLAELQFQFACLWNVTDGEGESRASLNDASFTVGERSFREISYQRICDVIFLDFRDGMHVAVIKVVLENQQTSGLDEKLESWISA
jgi:hypothetical protein